MCGINGIISDNSEVKRQIKGMNRLLEHRGPDDEGFVCINSETCQSRSYSGNDSIESARMQMPDISEGNLEDFDIIFGTRRLSVIDLSENGHQPMSDSAGKIWITYNGEIYNYIELREELESFGFEFRTQTDTEVVIYSYLKWGEECLNRFNGMWGFALWDGYKKKLILARDRFGVKPLYYSHTNNYFAFSSEIKPLIYVNPKRFEVNVRKVPFFIVYGNRLSGDETFVNNVHSLNPAHYLVYSQGKPKIIRYYDISSRNLSGKNENQLATELTEILADSVRLRFRSDVPVGTCLSGGFDSSSIVSMSSRIKKGINTFSAVWTDKECDESEYIDIINDEFNCVENKVEPKAEEFEEVFGRLNYYQEIPTEGPGLLPQWYVMGKAREKVKVLLDGQGGDEVFGGYFQTQSYLRSLIKDRQYARLFSEMKLLSKYFKKSELHTFSSWLFPKLYNRLVRENLSEIFNILNKDLRKSVGRKELHYDAETPRKFKHYLSNLSYHFVTHLTIPTLLHYEDRSSMAHSIESRVPFLDYRIVEFGINLPPEFVVNRHSSRPLFRKALGKYLPEEIINRKDKLGYPTPFAKWSRTELKPMVTDILLSSNKLSPFVNQTFLEKQLKRHFENKMDYSWDIWRLLSLEKFLSLPKLIQTQPSLQESII